MKACFKTLESGCKVLVYGVNLNVASTLSDDAERVVIASSLPVIEILRVYKLWFRIECMFRFLKSKVFATNHFISRNTATGTPNRSGNAKADRLLIPVRHEESWKRFDGRSVRAFRPFHWGLGKPLEAFFALHTSINTV